MTDKARELLEAALDHLHGMNSYEDCLLKNRIRTYLAEPEVKREALSDYVVTDSYLQVQPILGEYLTFKAGFRMAEKMHGIGCGDE